MGNDKHSAERLQQLHQRIEQWRLTRRQLGPMPDELWEAAASLAQDLGVSQVARALGLGYASLQQRVRSSSESQSAAKPVSGCGFVELHSAQPLGAPTVGSHPGGVVVEVAGGEGTRLIIRLPASSTLDVVGLIAAFRGSGA
jgi:hypothetical protein